MFHSEELVKPVMNNVSTVVIASAIDVCKFCYILWTYAK